MKKSRKDKLKKLASLASISLSVALCLLKVPAFFYSDSLSVLSSLVDSLSDILASLVTFFAIRVAMKPASCSYRYGYGKAEALSSLFQSAFVVLSAIFIFYDAMVRFYNPVLIDNENVAIGVMLVSLVTTICLVKFQYFVAKVTKSKAIIADSMHYKVDILTGISIIISLYAVKWFGVMWVDTCLAAAISIYLLYNAFDVGKDAVSLLLDKELSEEIRNSIFEIVKKHPKQPQIHDLRTHDLGGCYLFEFHIELDGNLDLKTTHTYTEEVEKLILKQYPDAQIVVHQDPIGIEEDRLDNRLQKSRSSKKKAKA